MRLRAWTARLTGPTARKGTWAVADQAVVSGTRFATGITLARCTAPSEYGSYVLALSVLLFVNGFQAALITGPMTVLGAAREGDEFRRYVTTLALVQVAGGLVLAVFLFSATWVMAFTSASAGLRGAFLGMAVALFFVQAQEFVRRVLFTRLMPSRVLLNDAVYCTLQLGGLFGLWRMDAAAGFSGEWLSGRNVMLCVAGSAFLVGFLGLLQLRGFLVMSLEGARGFLRENWGFGKWLLGSRVGGLLLGHANYFVVSAFAGVAGAATLAAPRLLLAPLQVFSFAGESTLMPRAAQKYGRSGRKALLGFLASAGIICGIVFAGYSLVVFVAPETWLQIAYHGKYEGAGLVLRLWAARFAVVGFHLMPRIGLGAVRRPDLLMRAFVGASFAMLTASVWLSWQHGAVGAAVARLLGEIVLFFAVLLSCIGTFGGAQSGHTK